LSLRWKLLLPLLVAAVLLVLVMDRFWLQRSLAQVEATQAQAMRHHLESVAEGMVPLVMGHQLDIIHENLDSLLSKNPDWLSVILTDALGRQLYPPRLGEPTAPPAKGGNLHEISLDLDYAGHHQARMVAIYDMTPHMDRQRQEYHQMSLILLAILAASMAIVWVVVEQVIYRPLRRLSAAAAELARQNYEAPLPNAGRDEMGALVSSFDGMRTDLKSHHAELSREIEVRRQAEAKLLDYQTHLEQMVAQRTTALREAELMYRTVADFAYDWETWIAPDGQYIYCSPSSARVTGHAAEDFFAHPDLLIEITHPDDRAAMHAHIRGYHEEVGPEEFNFRIQLPDGRVRWLEHACQPVYDPDGNPLGRRASNRDITARKEVEARLAEARDAAEAASRAKSAFLANMSHELRTPMNAIMGMTWMALRKAEDPTLRDHLGKIEQASEHLQSLINDILDISKIEADRLALDKSDFTLGEVIRKASALIAQKAADKGLKVHVRLPPGLATETLAGDPLRLGQILINLLGNAVKFTQQGSITLRADVVETGVADLLIRFEVQDTGIGIAPADQKRLFQAFEQADNSMTRKYGGTGLGLSISKRLVEMMGGEIGVESTPGQGSTVWFSARLCKAVGAAPEAGAERTDLDAKDRLQREYADTRVLVVEDEPINQEVACSLLREVGLAVAVANDGAEALELARRDHYALILMDMQMPRMNGVDATRAIRADSLNAATPILAMTANAFTEDRLACLEAGMNDHIAKPIDTELLYVTLLKWLAPARS
jgi:PAS domain S-box-containing protein